MIDHVNRLLRRLFITAVDEIVSEEQVQFRPPDEQWRTGLNNITVDGNPANALNVYLVDLKENLQLRSNEWERRHIDNEVVQTPAPRRVDCHYLVSAWSPAQESMTVEPAMEEHALFYKVAKALLHCEPLVAQQIYGIGGLPPDFPEEIADAHLPVRILPAEGFPKLAEFWGTMGNDHRWKPVVYLVITIPVGFIPMPSGPMVTTRITEYRRPGHAGSSETLVQIGGHVLDARTNPASPVPVVKAWVRLETEGGEPLQTAETDARGRFTFGMLVPGRYRLHWQATGFPAAVPRTVDVPSPRRVSMTCGTRSCRGLINGEEKQGGDSE